jgi:sec-independent protein translocase protein TatB
VFNLSGSEIFFLLLIGLVVLGPEKLPEAMRKAGRLYQEVRKITGGIQSDLRSSFEDPVNELRKTADQAKRIMTGNDEPAPPAPAQAPSSSPHVEAKPAEPEFIPYLAPVSEPVASDDSEPDAPSRNDT